MAHKKAAGKLNQQTRPQPKHLGLKATDGQGVIAGSIIVRQRGTRMKAGDGVSVGRDHTLFATKDGTVKFYNRQGSLHVRVI